MITTPALQINTPRKPEARRIKKHGAELVVM